MKVVIGCPVANRGWILQDWIDAARANAANAGAELEIVLVTTPSTDDTDEIAERNGCTVIEADAATRAAANIDTHYWDAPQFEYMAELRNMLLDHCIEVEADYLFSIDSDILAAPFTLSYLANLRTINDVHVTAPLVNLSRDALGPVWNFMRWSPKAQMYERPPLFDTPELVDAAFAAMLIYKSAFDVRWQGHPQGEDLGWATNARRLGKHVMVEPRHRCEHVMVRPA